MLLGVLYEHDTPVGTYARIYIVYACKAKSYFSISIEYTQH